MTQQSESQAMAHEATLFVMQMAGDSMINAGIHNGDLLIVDRSLAPVPGDVVAAVMDDEIAIKRLVSRAGITILHAENPRYPDLHAEQRRFACYLGHRHRCHSPVDIVIGPSHQRHPPIPARPPPWCRPAETPERIAAQWHLW